MKIYDDTKFFIFAPAKYYSGGALVLHQLGSALKRLNYDVYMFYFDPYISGLEAVHPLLRKFHLPVADAIEDEPKNIVIVPEVVPSKSTFIRNAQIIIWWLSVDNHFNVFVKYINKYVEQRFFLNYPAPTLHPIKFFECDHLYQSEYARQFLIYNGLPEEKIFALADYLDPDFLLRSPKIDLSLKKNIVVFNPKKGFEFTKKIMEASQGLDFLPIYDMTPEEVRNLLARSKIYIDFGEHPGKDRIPRESAMSHCVVITSRRGAADNSIDVPIDDDFKFEDIPENIPAIIEKIKYVFENFKTEHDRQNSYREIISHEQDKFFDDVDSIFKQDSKPRMKIAIAGSLQDMEEICDELIHERDIEIVFAVNDELAGNIVNYNDILDLEVISTADAEFLYNERRIDQFVVR